MEEKTVSINGLRVNFKVAGEGPAILILHGWGGSSDSWLKVQEVLSGKGYQVFCPDIPGFGKSSPPPAPWSVSDYVDWAFSFSKSQKLNNFILLGHSFGGRAAVKFAVSFPEKLKSLILCDSAGIKKEPDKKTKNLLFISHIGNTIFSSKIFSKFKDRARNIFYFFLRNKDYVKAKGVMRETMKQIIKEDIVPYLGKIKTKTLIIWGKKDKTVSLEDAYVLKDKIVNSSLEIIPGVGHSPHLEKPERLSEIILSFL